MTNRYHTNLRLINLNMLYFLPGYRGSVERPEDVAEDMTLALAEVRYNMPRLKASDQVVKDEIILWCHLAYGNLDPLDRADAIRWIRNNKSQECKDVVDRTIQATEYVIEKTLEGTLKDEAVQGIILAKELRPFNKVMDLVADYKRSPDYAEAAKLKKFTE